MNRFLSPRQSLSPIVLEYSKWVIASGAADDIETLRPIFARLGVFDDINANIEVVITQNNQNKPFNLDQVREEALLALGQIITATSDASLTRQLIRRFLISVLSNLKAWKTHSKFKHTEFIEAMSLNLAQSLSPKSEDEFFGLVSKFVSEALNDSADVEFFGNITSGFFRGILLNTTLLSHKGLKRLAEICIQILSSDIYDLREFLPEAPVGTPLNELLRKYFILPAAAMASTFNSLRQAENLSAFDAPTLDSLCTLLITYISSISSFLSHCASHEAELIALLKLILKMTKLCISVNPACISEVFGPVHIYLQSRHAFSNVMNYQGLVSDSCQLVLECAKLHHELIFNATACLRDAVIALDIEHDASTPPTVVVDFFDVAASIGPYIGALFRLQLDHNEDRSVCDSILNSLLDSMPEDDSLELMSARPRAVLRCPYVISTLGHIAGVSGDEQIALSCLASITAQFNKGNYGQRARIFLTQFNLIAVTGSGSLLATILDIYTNIIAQSDLVLATIAMDEIGKSLVPLCRHDSIKLEVLLFTLMRAFVEKGLQMAKKSEKSDKLLTVPNGNVDSSPAAILRPILFAIWSILEHLNVDKCINKAVLVDLFQEFWFVLIYHGYQPSLKWNALWQEFIPRFSEKSPLLIKEKDRIQTATTISLSVLTQSTNLALKTHLLKFMPIRAVDARNISMAQCLWLMAFFLCEKNKLELGQMEYFMEYLKSDVIYYLDLYPLVEDLSLTILKDWLSANMIRRRPETTKLALIVLRGCGHIQRRIHKTCMSFLKLIMNRERGLEGCTQIWTGLLDKIDFLYKACKAELGMKPDPDLLAAGEYIKDPEYAKEAFEDVLKFAREVFQTASYLNPFEYYNFAMNYFRSGKFPEVNLANRDVPTLELLRSCVPEPNYFDLPLEMHRNSETHFKWYLLSSTIENANVALDAEMTNNLSVDWLWHNKANFSNEALKNLIIFIAQTSVMQPHPNMEHLRCLVHIPFLSGAFDIMQFAIKVWMQLITRKFEGISSIALILGEVDSAWEYHEQLKIGIFSGEAAYLDPFMTKFTSTPSKPGYLEPGLTVSTYYLYLVDFLRERFLLDSREQPECLPLFVTLILSLSQSTLNFQHHGWSRAARFRIILLSYELLTFMRNFWSDQFVLEIYALKANIYASFINFFEMPKSWSIESKNLCEFEVRTINALLDYIDKDLVVQMTLDETVLLREAIEQLVLSRSASQSDLFTSSKSVASSASESKVMSNSAASQALVSKPSASAAASTISLRQLIKSLLTHENEGIQVWIGTFKLSKMSLPARAFWRELANLARSYSPLLAIRFCQMVKMEPELNLIIAQTTSIKGIYWRYLQSVRIMEYFTAGKIEISNVECFLYSSSISPPQALTIFRQHPFKQSPKYLNYAMRSLESYPPDLLYFYIPQLVQNLRHDEIGYTEVTIMHIVKVSSLFAHQVIWNMNANMFIDDAGEIADPMKPKLEAMVARIASSLQGEEQELYQREFSFFAKITGISGLLKPYIRKEKWEKKKKIDEELAKIEADPGVYLPSNPESCVIDIDYKSGRPLQSFAKAPFMATFKVRNMHDPASEPVWQSCIFKVGDDCRQDVMTLQLISAIKSIFEQSHLHLYLFPYRVVATAPGCGVIEVIPNSISRDMLGREKINSLYEYFWFKYGNPNGLVFQTAREEFIKSMAGYSIITFLVAIRDRHNGNIMIDDQGHVVHIDFGFILDIAPGGITFEKSPFKLTSEMIQVMGGKEESSPYFTRFQHYCVEAFLVLRPFAEQLIQLVDAMKESGLPCFKYGDVAIKNLRSRFRLDLDDAEASSFISNLVAQSCENFRTGLYDFYQNYENGIPY